MEIKVFIRRWIAWFDISALVSAAYVDRGSHATATKDHLDKTTCAMDANAIRKHPLFNVVSNLSRSDVCEGIRNKTISKWSQIGRVTFLSQDVLSFFPRDSNASYFRNIYKYRIISLLCFASLFPVTARQLFRLSADERTNCIEFTGYNSIGNNCGNISRLSNSRCASWLRITFAVMLRFQVVRVEATHRRTCFL